MMDRSAITCILVALVLSTPLLLVDGPPSGTDAEVHTPSTPEAAADMIDTFAIQNHFVRNDGQLDEDAGAYYAQGDPLSVSFGPSWVLYSLRRDGVTATYRVSFPGSNMVDPVGTRELGHYSNYFSGKDPAKWRTRCPHFEEVLYLDLYDGIDLRFLFTHDMLKYEFIVGTSGEPKDIHMGFEGVDSLEIQKPSGDLIVHTSAGAVQDDAPKAWQSLQECHSPVDCCYKLTSDGKVRFKLGERNLRCPLVIDPGIGFSTYLGGSGIEYGYEVAVDSEDNIVLAGRTDSIDFPTMPGAFCETKDTSDYDLFVCKMKSDGSDLLFSSFLRGNDIEYPDELAIDLQDSIYVVGATASDDFPTTPGVFQENLSRFVDGFILKIKSDGSSLFFSSFIGGSQNDFCEDLTFHSNGSIFITGTTKSVDFPVLPSCYDTNKGNEEDGFVISLDQDCTNLFASTFIGGNSNDYGSGVRISCNNTVYVVGTTQSTDFYTTQGVVQQQPRGNMEGFISILDENLTHIIASSLFGGSSFDTIDDLEMGYEDTPTVIGYTASSNLNVTEDALDTSKDGRSDVHVTVFNTKLTDLIFSTYLGGSGYEEARSISIGSTGEIHILCTSDSLDFPISEAAIDKTSGGIEEFSLAVLNISFHDRYYGTYLTGKPYTETGDIALSSTGSVIVIGHTDSTNFPTTPGAHDRSLGGIRDAFVMKLDDVLPPIFADDGTPPSTTTGSTLDVNLTVKDNEAVANVTLTYWFEDRPSPRQQRMTLTTGDATDGTYALSVQVPLDTRGPLSYYAVANDTTGNRIETGTRNVTVLDDDAPLITDLSQASATTGDAFALSARVLDNIQVEEARVVHWFGDDEASAENRSMDVRSQESPANVTFSLDIDQLPENSTAPLSYYILALDESGNWNRTPTRTLEVLDDDRPDLGGDASDGEATTGEPFSFNASFTDNIGVHNVTVSYQFGDGPAEHAVMSPVDVGAMGNGSYGLVVTVPSNASGHLRYHFTALDPAGNARETPLVTLLVLDDDPPSVTDATSSKAIKGLEHVLAANVSDNVEVAACHVVYNIAGGAEVNATMTLVNGTYTLAVQVPRDAAGTLEYTLLAVDASGNWGASPLVTLPLVNAPPSLEDMPVWEVTEGQESTLDLADLLSDRNDPVPSLVIECSDTNVTVNGTVLEATFDVWVPEHQVELSVSDGEDVTYANVTVRIEDVNDGPRLVDPPTTAVQADEDATFTLRLEADDEEGDTFTWSDDSDLFDIDPAIGEMSFVPLQSDVGTHEVTITVTDDRGGVNTFSLTVEVVNVNDAPVISSLSPENGTKVKKGKTVELGCVATDEDGDGLTYTWKLGTEVLGEGAELPYKDLPKGTHGVTVEVSDGNATTTGTVTVIVEEEKGSPVEGLAVMTVIALLMVMIAVRRTTVRR